MHDIARNLKRLRRQKGLTQEELADKLHVTRQAAFEAFRREYRPSVGYWLDIYLIWPMLGIALGMAVCALICIWRDLHPQRLAIRRVLFWVAVGSALLLVLSVLYQYWGPWPFSWFWYHLSLGLWFSGWTWYVIGVLLFCGWGEKSGLISQPDSGKMIGVSLWAHAYPFVKGVPSVMKVLYLLNFAGKAGTERYVETLVKYLSADGLVQPYFAYNEGGLLVERLEAMGVPCRRVEMRSRFDKQAARELAALCQEWDIDLIHCHYLREHYTALLAKKYNKKIRVVYTNHFVLANDFITRLSNRMMDKRQDQMIAVCNKGKEQLIANGWSGDRIQVIFNAVDLDAWAGGRADSTLRAELGLDEDRFVMLCASRFAEDKGHKYLIDSVKRLTERTDRPFTLVLAGDGPLLEPTKAQVAELGLEDCVKFIGFRKDMKNLYKGSDLYVNSSQHEALSFLIIEAMAAGLPVIATDMGGNSDIVNDEAGCGLLVEYDNPDSMAGAMKRFLEEPEFLARCRENARKTIEDKFEIHKMCRATYGVYEKALHD